MTFPRRLALVSAAALVLAPVSAANILVNGGFEDQPNWGINGDGGYTRLSGGEMPGWVIADGHSVTVHREFGYPTISGNYSINMDGEGFNDHNADFYQDFATEAGHVYTLEYDWSTWTFGTPVLGVQVINLADSSLVVNDEHGWVEGGVHHESIQFVGTGGSFRLRVLETFESGINDNTFIVDNFQINEVPGPGVAVVLACAGLMRSRRRPGR